MKKTDTNKEAYRRLRALEWDRLWDVEVPAFDAASSPERLSNVSLVRAVGVVFSESGNPEQKEDVARWLRSLLRDPAEKIRRYAMAALPKIGAGAAGESDLIGLLQRTTLDREKAFLARSLDKMGGKATLAAIESSPGLLPVADQKIRANVIRELQPGAIALDRPLAPPGGFLIHLRCRRGLEDILRGEVEATCANSRFRVASTAPGLLSLHPTSVFCLRDLYALRCFATPGFVLGNVRADSPSLAAEIARSVASPLARSLLKTWTDGPPRYRIEFVGRGHLRGLVKDITRRAYAETPDILNDARSALWSVDVHPDGPHLSVELRPRLSPDPRFDFRRADVPAASHPPLAACMARLAGPMDPDGLLWDPFCGSGLELVERARLGGVSEAWGSDLSPEAIAIAQRNFSAAQLLPPGRFTCCDFRDFPRISGLPLRSVGQIITNPPLGRRVPIRNLPGLISDLLSVAGALLRPGGSLVFVNPVAVPSPPRSLRLESSKWIDLGGFDCRLEHYRKDAAG